MKTTKRKRGVPANAAAPAAMTVVEAPAAAASEESAGAAPSSVAAAPTIVLASHCNVKDATAFKQTLIAAFDATEAVSVDVAAVERIDTAAMQLLCAFARDRAANGRAITWRGDSTAFKDAVRLLGVGSLLSFTSDSRKAAA